MTSKHCLFTFRVKRKSVVAQTILLEVLVDGNILQEERTSSISENRSTTPPLVGQNLQFVVDINMGR